MGVRDRVYRKKGDATSVFVPMNMESTYNDKDSSMLAGAVIITALFVILVFGTKYVMDRASNALGVLLWLVLWAFVSQWILRFIVFKERALYKWYSEFKKQRVVTPANYMNIVSISNDEDGAQVRYADGSVAVLVRMIRGAIVGKEDDKEDVHYNIISDVYSYIVENEYEFIHANNMDISSKDARLDRVAKIVEACDNSNAKKLAERNLGYCKNISKRAMMETEFIMIRTRNKLKAINIIDDANAIISMLVKGGYSKAYVMNRNEVLECIKDEQGVGYFDYNNSVVETFKTRGITTNKIKIQSIELDGNEVVELNDMARNLISNKASGKLVGAINSDDSILLKEIINKSRGIEVVVGVDKNEVRENEVVKRGILEKLEHRKETLNKKVDNRSEIPHASDVKNGNYEQVVEDEDDVIDF